MSRLRKSLLTLGLLLGLAVAAGVFWREVVVEAAARFGLSAGGLGDARFTVTEVGWSEILIEDLSLGPGLPEARRVRLRYTPAELMSGRVREALVEGMRFALPADWKAARRQIRALSSGGGDGWLDVSRVRLQNAIVGVDAPVEGAITLDGTLDLAGERPAAALEVRLALAGTEGSFAARSRSLGPGGTMEISGGGQSRLAELSLSAGGARLTGGRATFTVDGVVPIPAGEGGGPPLWPDGAVALEGALRLAGVTVADAPGALTTDLDWTLRSANGALRLDLPRPADFEVSRIVATLPEELRLSVEQGGQDLSARLSAPGPLVLWSQESDGGTLELVGDLAVEMGAASGEIRGTVRLRHDDAWRLSAPADIEMDGVVRGVGLSKPSIAGRLREAEWDLAGSIGADGAVALDGRLSSEVGDLSLATLKAEKVVLDGDLRLDGSPRRWTARLAPGAALAADGVMLPGTVRLGETLAVGLERLEVTGGVAPPRVDLAGTAGPVDGVLRGSADREIPFQDARARVSLKTGPEEGGGVLRVEEGGATFPRDDVNLSAVSATVPVAAMNAGPMLVSAEVRDTGGTARFVPVRVDLEGRPEGGRVAIAGTIATLNGAIRLPLSGFVDPAVATGRIVAGPQHVRFSEGGLQPGALSRRLAPIRGVTGAVSVSGQIALDAGGDLRTRLALALEGLALGSDDLAVEGLSGRVTFSELSPPATAGPQELSARRAIAGVPIEAPRVRFTLPPRSDRPLVRIHEAAGSLAGGDLVVEDAVWNSAARENALAIRVRSVSIERLLSEWQIEGITGTGRLSGLIPVRFGPAGLVIEDGRLAAGGGGVISVDWGAARQTLVDSGEQVARHRSRRVQPGGARRLSVALQHLAQRQARAHPGRGARGTADRGGASARRPRRRALRYGLDGRREAAMLAF